MSKVNAENNGARTRPRARRAVVPATNARPKRFANPPVQTSPGKAAPLPGRPPEASRIFLTAGRN
jgi:hypothetical protein